MFSTRLKPAHPTFEAWMVTLLNSNLSEILGHEITLKYLSSRSPKVELKDQPWLPLSSSLGGGNALPGYKFQPAATSLMVMQLA